MVFTGGITGAMRWGYPKGGLFTIFFMFFRAGENTGAMSGAVLFHNFFLVCLDAQL